MAKVAALIPAAGQGTRMGAKVNKQLLKLFGKPVLAYTLEVFQQCSLIDQIIVVAAKSEIPVIEREIVQAYHFTKVVGIVPGGEQRQDSVRKGLENMDSAVEWVVVHDGARPLLLLAEVENIVKRALAEGTAMIAAVPVKDTIKQVDSAGKIRVTLPRKTLWAAQTPQVFPKSLLIAAHRQSVLDGISATDDAGLVEMTGVQVAVTMGSYENIKITTPEDLDLALGILRRRNAG